MEALRAIIGITACLLFFSVAVEAEVLLMQHGGLLRGQVSESDAGYLVTGEGQEFSVPRSRVAGRFADEHSAYVWLADRIDQGKAPAEARLRLAEWCLTNDLLDAAAEQVAAAERISPENPRVERLAAQIDQIAAQRLNQPSSTVDQAVRPATFQQDVTQQDVTQVEKLELPPEHLSEFTRRIQPLLVNNCTTAGCHQHTSTAETTGGFVLDRRLLHGYANARSTNSNLRAVLRAIDTESPGESPLLMAAGGPHAGVTPLKGPRRDEWLSRLNAWVAQVAVTSQQARETREQVIRDEAVSQAGYLRHHMAQDGPPEPRPLPGYGPADASGFQPRDEFDPGIFNRQYRDQKTDAVDADTEPAE